VTRINQKLKVERKKMSENMDSNKLSERERREKVLEVINEIRQDFQVYHEKDVFWRKNMIENILLMLIKIVNILYGEEL
jgi:hypothetical protein